VVRLTRQEQMVLYMVMALLLVGGAVKAWRTARPAPVAAPAPSD
jgi:hypothetical protein